MSGPVGKELREVFLVLGWNTNRDLDEIDLVESCCFPSLTQANAALAELQAALPGRLESRNSLRLALDRRPFI